MMRYNKMTKTSSLVILIATVWAMIAAMYFVGNRGVAKADDAASMPWCVQINVTWREGTETGKVCTKTEDLCKEVQRVAKNFIGTDSGINKVGKCKD